MARGVSRPEDLATVIARRDALAAELAAAEEQVRAAEAAARDAGRPVLQAALARVKIAAIGKADAKTIADAIGRLGGELVAAHLKSLPDA